MSFLYKNKLRVMVITSMLFIIMIYGVRCNFTAIKENHGKMPVYIPNISSWGDFNEGNYHFFYSNFSEVKYPEYTDIITLDIGKYLLWISLGDILSVGGAILYGFYSIGMLFHKD